MIFDCFLFIWYLGILSWHLVYRGPSWSLLLLIAVTAFFLVRIWNAMEPTNPGPIHQPAQPVPQVTGYEEEDRLIYIRCPHCHEMEWRVFEGENWCEITGDPFFLTAIPWTPSYRRSK